MATTDISRSLVRLRLRGYFFASFFFFPQLSKKGRGDARIELATSCTQSRNHTTRPITRRVSTVTKKKEVLPGLEPGLQGSKPWVLTNYTIEPVPETEGTERDNKREKRKRHRRDLNSRGQSPLAFKTNSLTTRTRCLDWYSQLKKNDFDSDEI